MCSCLFSSTEMNTTVWIVDNYQEAITKHIVIVFLALIVNVINGMLVVTFFSSHVFSRDSRYILYIHLVINDMLMICASVAIYVLTYIAPVVNASLCYILMSLGKVFFMITPLNLAGMAIERFIAVCKPLHHSQICTPQRTYVFFCLLWGIAAIRSVVDIMISLLTQPISFFRSFVPCYPTYMFPSKAHDDHNTASQVICMSMVWIIICYTYCRVLFAARKAVSKGSASKARSTILLHGVQLLLCMLSYVTPFMYTLIIPLFPLQRTNIAFCIYVFTNIMPRLLSPLIYGVRDQKFIKQMKEVFTCKVIFLKIVPS
uniref:Odorant receptor, family H, subfamily 136, member 1 n=2 Tax=Danio rerio TaxID=7955 RepID=B3DH97_DANRE|nr:odorant receptor 136-1 [Danio rerio]AAI62687.1 Unknown (protein for MGC:194103) [Danio rerio]|eukprot:NP_001129719.1 odorant receptor, family H, subfamily 136, member 1 [Danio rerio]